MMDATQKERYLGFLYQYISANKRNKIEEIVMNRTRYLAIVLEDLFQSHNASAVLRTCDCTGVQDVHAIENRNKFEPHPDIALGSAKWLSIHRYRGQDDNTSRCIGALRGKGYKIVATTPHSRSFSLDDIPLGEKMAVFFGTELEGLSETVLAQADYCLRIPMYGFTESFNISVSAALTLFTLMDRIRKSDIRWQLEEEESVDVKIAWACNIVKRPELLLEKFLEMDRGKADAGFF